MACRKWLVRLLVFSIVGGLGAVASLYQRWTSPTAIRQQLLAKLGLQFPGALISVSSAHLRLLGGIAVDDLRLCRRDDPDRVEFGHVPSAVIYHDKEQLMEGRLVIRKVELIRPHLRVIRTKDGRLNLLGIIGKPQLHIAIPTIVVSRGTIVIEDWAADTPRVPLEIKDVSLTLVNDIADPLNLVGFRGAGCGVVSGKITTHGAWSRVTEAVTLNLAAPAIPVSDPLMQLLAAYAPKIAEHAGRLEGSAAVQAELGFQPEPTPRWTHNVRLHLTKGSLRHHLIPRPLEQIEATVRCLDGQLRVESCTARAGTAHVELKGWARVPSGNDSSLSHRPNDVAAAPKPDSLIPEQMELEGQLKVAHLHVQSELFAALPQKLQKLEEDFHPSGTLSFTYDVSHTAGHWKRHCSARLEDVTATYEKFKYWLHHVQGSLEHDLDTEFNHETLSVDLVGKAGTQDVFIKGTVAGAGPTSGVDVKIWGQNLVIDDSLMQAIPQEPTRELARKFHPQGQLNFQSSIQRAFGTPNFTNRYLLQFHDASVRFDVFPYPIEQVSGCLDIQNTKWEFRDFFGTHRGAIIRAHGRTLHTPEGERLLVEIRGNDVALDEDLELAIAKGELKELVKTWKMFNPSGKMHFAAQVDRLSDKPPEADVSITALGCGIKPQFFPFQLHDLTGKLRYTKRWVVAEQLRARHGDTVLMIDNAKAYVKPNGGVFAELVYLRGKSVALDRELIAALPPPLKKICTMAQLSSTFQFDTKLTIDTVAEHGDLPTIYWDGGLAVEDASLYAGLPMRHVTGTAACKGNYNGRQLDGLAGNVSLKTATIADQPIQNLHTRIEIGESTPDILKLTGLKGDAFGGEVYGQARVEFGSAPRYELDLTASRVRLEQFAKHNLGPDAPVSGWMDGKLYLSGQGGDVENMTGRGRVDIPKGRLYNLPVMLGLLKILELRLPDGTLFEEGHANFTISGPKVLVNRVDLYGNPLSLRGHGEVNSKGVNLEFYAVWARITQFLPPLIKEIPPAVSQQLLKIKMQGPFGEIRCTKEPVPIIVEPLKELRGAFSARWK